MNQWDWPDTWRSSELVLLSRDVVEDFSYSAPMDEVILHAPDVAAALKDKPSVDGICKITEPGGGARIPKRFNAVLSFNGERVSFTVRASQAVTKQMPTRQLEFETRWKVSPEKPLPLFLLVKYLWEAGVREAILEDPAGLILIVGRTGAAKSQIAQGLIHKILESNVGNDRRPHLISLEDPIEKHLYEAPLSPDTWNTLIATGVADYSPRTLHHDTLGAKEFFTSALRQTPAVAYVSETREKPDWKEVIEFAGTGHLVLTTTHAGGVIEAMAKIFDALDCLETQARKLFVASRLRAIIHLGSHKIETVDTDGDVLQFKVAFPSIWTGGPAALSILSSDHLGGLLPAANPSALGATSLRGQVSFVNWLTELVKSKPSEVSAGNWDALLAFLTGHQLDTLKQLAMKYDLQPH